MGDQTGIEWTDATWNPVTGCTRVSRGCDNCYAEVLANRLLKKLYTSRLPVIDSVQNRGDPFTNSAAACNRCNSLLRQQYTSLRDDFATVSAFQVEQAATQFSHVFSPPDEIGIT